MTTTSHTWENTLNALAHEAWQAMIQPPALIEHDADVLARAYEQCQTITKEHSRSFYMASGLLPSEKRLATRALYAFCRVTDDIVDRSTGNIASELEEWRQLSLSQNPGQSNPIALAWTDTRHRYSIPKQYAEQLIEGVARDLYQTRYESFNDLATYCYGVASTVGLMSMHIIGFSGREAIPYAIKLGVALQLTNILRDVGEDLRNGRIYLPQEVLAQFDITESDLMAGRVTSDWQAFMRFQIARTRQLYEEALPGIAKLNEDGRFAIAAAAGLYRGILDDIERNHYDVFSRRAYVSKWGKLRRLPALWLQAKRYPNP